MRLLAVLFITLFAGGQSHPPSTTPVKAAHSNEHKANLKNDQPAPNDQVTRDLTAAINKLTAAIENRQTQEQATQANPGAPSELWAILVAIFTGVLAIVGVLQWITMRRQMNISDKQVGISEALIASERPWVTATVRKKAIQKIPITGQSVDIADATEHFWFYFVLKNVGRTPAEIRAVRGDPRLTDKGIDGGFTTETTPDYGLPVAFRQVRLLAPNEEWTLYDVQLHLLPYSPDEVTKIKDGQLHIIYAGQVIYRDTLRPEVDHETAFCYTYLSFPDDYVHSGPPQFTKYT